MKRKEKIHRMIIQFVLAVLIQWRVCPSFEQLQLGSNATSAEIVVLPCEGMKYEHFNRQSLRVAIYTLIFSNLELLD